MQISSKLKNGNIVNQPPEHETSEYAKNFYVQEHIFSNVNFFDIEIFSKKFFFQKRFFLFVEQKETKKIFFFSNVKNFLNFEKMKLCSSVTQLLYIEFP